MGIDFSKVEFDASNLEPRCPCILLLDVSGSMGGAPINELNAGLKAFKDALSSDEIAMQRVEVAIVTFGPVTPLQDFVSAAQFEPPVLSAEGDTPMGAAIDLALDMLNERKQTYKQHGISYYRPWVFLITDGAPNPGEDWQSTAQRVRNEASKKKISFFAVAVGKANMGTLEQFSVGRAPVKLDGLKFRELFEWLSTSLSSVSQSKPGEDVPLQSPMGPKGWATV